MPHCGEGDGAQARYPYVHPYAGVLWLRCKVLTISCVFLHILFHFVSHSKLTSLIRMGLCGPAFIYDCSSLTKWLWTTDGGKLRRWKSVIQPATPQERELSSSVTKVLSIRIYTVETTHDILGARACMGNLNSPLHRRFCNAEPGSQISHRTQPLWEPREHQPQTHRLWYWGLNIGAFTFGYWSEAVFRVWVVWVVWVREQLCQGDRGIVLL